MPVNDTAMGHFYRNATYWLESSKNRRQSHTCNGEPNFFKINNHQGLHRQLNTLSRYGQCLIKKNVPV